MFYQFEDFLFQIKINEKFFSKTTTLLPKLREYKNLIWPISTFTIDHLPFRCLGKFC